MTISRVNAPGWSVNDKLTSAQANGLDLNTTYALDKRSSQTDTLNSVITVPGAGSGQIIANGSAAINANATTAITASALGGVQATIAGGIQSTAVGGIQLAGGASDWVTCTPPKVRNIVVPCQVYNFDISGFQQTSSGVLSASTGGGFAVLFPPHHGTTITSVTLLFAVGSSHANVPTITPAINVFRCQDMTVTGVPPVAATSLKSSGYTFFVPSPNTGAGYYASGNVQSLTMTCDQNNVVDRTKYYYMIGITDEGTTNGAAGNLYMACVVTFANIQDMRFP